ncbi:MAG: hypothetical protein MUE63_15490 [Xanthomonadales bacterium]|jgi:hypothetical protein|nr:hypothetical protein [Xanthomonadales bacterium]
MEVQAGEGLRVAIEEAWRLAADHAVERCHALLPVEQQLHDARRQRAFAAARGGLAFGGPNQQAAHRVAVQRFEQPAHLVAVPRIAALELGQRHVPAVDVIQDRRDLHVSRILPVSSVCIMPCSSWRGAQEFQTPSARAGRVSGRGLHRAEVREVGSACGKTGLLRLIAALQSARHCRARGG